MERIQAVVICDGGINYFHEEYPCSRMIGSVEWDMEFELKPMNYAWFHENEGEAVIDQYLSRALFITLWPLPLLWLLGWVGYLIRVHRLARMQHTPN